MTAEKSMELTKQRHRELALLAEESYRRSTYIAGESECLASFQDGELWLAMCGTEMSGRDADGFFQRMKSRIIDTLNDIRAIPKRTMIGRVHRGFYTGLGGGALGIYKLITARYDTSIPIRVTGHSKGGGEARLLAAMLANSGYKVLSLVDFGSPRAIVGRCEGLNKIGEVVAYRNGSDPVTALPRGWIWSYTHPHEVNQGVLIQLGEDYSISRLSAHKYHSIYHYLQEMKGLTGAMS